MFFSSLERLFSCFRKKSSFGSIITSAWCGLSRKYFCIKDSKYFLSRERFSFNLQRGPITNIPSQGLQPCCHALRERRIQTRENGPFERRISRCENSSNKRAASISSGGMPSLTSLRSSPIINFSIASLFCFTFPFTPLNPVTNKVSRISPSSPDTGVISSPRPDSINFLVKGEPSCPKRISANVPNATFSLILVTSEHSHERKIVALLSLPEGHGT